MCNDCDKQTEPTYSRPPEAVNFILFESGISIDRMADGRVQITLPWGTGSRFGLPNQQAVMQLYRALHVWSANS